MCRLILAGSYVLFPQAERPARPGAITAFDVLLSNAGRGDISKMYGCALGDAYIS